MRREMVIIIVGLSTFFSLSAQGQAESEPSIQNTQIEEESNLSPQAEQESEGIDGIEDGSF